MGLCVCEVAVLRFTWLLLFISSLAEATQNDTVFYLARPRAVGRRVPSSLLFDLQGKLKTLINKNNHLLVEGEEDAQLVSGPQIDRRRLLAGVDAARRKHEELDLEGARVTLNEIVKGLEGLPLTADAREVWRAAQILLIEISEAEQDVLLRDRAIAELLRIMPRLKPRSEGLSGSLADLVMARKAGLKAASAVTFRVRPSDATILVDGRPARSGERFRPGQHRLLISAPGRRAHVETFNVETGGASLQLSATLGPARLPTIPQLDKALSDTNTGAEAINIMGDTTRQSGASVGLLATVGRRSDGRFNLHIAALGRDGSVLGVGSMVTGGLLALNDLGHLLQAASSKGKAATIASGDWAVETSLSNQEPDPADFAGLPISERRKSIPRQRSRSMPSQRSRPLLRSPNFWIFTGVALIGGGAAYLAFTLQEAPREEVILPPSMNLEVVLP
jgi:hypothetical protein